MQTLKMAENEFSQPFVCFYRFNIAKTAK